ncbi:hypothetical protein [Paraburkholderia dipogonis]|uniref:hypothetical protein n=1 Tax=Paraburkholderia dipogonis TaxID=1211383 RepID=UPI0038B7D7E5
MIAFEEVGQVQSVSLMLGMTVRRVACDAKSLCKFDQQREGFEWPLPVYSLIESSSHIPYRTISMRGNQPIRIIAFRLKRRIIQITLCARHIELVQVVNKSGIGVIGRVGQTPVIASCHHLLTQPCELV